MLYGIQKTKVASHIHKASKNCTFWKSIIAIFIAEKDKIVSQINANLCKKIEYQRIKSFFPGYPATNINVLLGLIGKPI